MPWSHLTLESWRASNVRVNFASKLLASRLGQDMIAVLQNTMPVPDISDATRAGLEGARVRGYMQAIHTILMMQTPAAIVSDLPEASYDTTADDMILQDTA
jgi:hypothetical protein